MRTQVHGRHPRQPCLHSFTCEQSAYAAKGVQQQAQQQTARDSVRMTSRRSRRRQQSGDIADTSEGSRERGDAVAEGSEQQRVAPERQSQPGTRDRQNSKMSPRDGKQHETASNEDAEHTQSVHDAEGKSSARNEEEVDEADERPTSPYRA